MKIAFIMRGVPGSGKTEVAVQLAGTNGVIHSTDTLRIVQGKYVFDPARNQEQHDTNFRAFCKSLEKGVEIVICDNTNTTRAEYQRYVEAAQNAGYLVAFVIMPHPDPVTAAQRNHHGVPQNVIEAMLARWEP